TCRTAGVDLCPGKFDTLTGDARDSSLSPAPIDLARHRRGPGPGINDDLAAVAPLARFGNGFLNDFTPRADQIDLSPDFEGSGGAQGPAVANEVGCFADALGDRRLIRLMKDTPRF